MIANNKSQIRGMAQGMEVQRDPYANLLSQREKQWARNLIPRTIFTSGCVGATAVYYLSRQNQLGRVKGLKITFDMVFGVVGRCLLAGVVAEQVSRRFFVNYQTLKGH